ncbi:TetR/AcrR family transcriptional regulator [Planococcus sp. CP5-4]|uniref:TetR/AcrR family transcriptional regulator n=1 Tax=unclassified Planococcus (in: firmicutes) TaxID=2662419 RepID=UPI001C2354AA|nr:MULTISPECIES: TetR/AcrR family transcriptional regulator [unclassified Planococcus (in: firmicutes)]MBU9674275.1 TetR/AcrR family transcriptional regulator [Planococcus sp. CP5-4_YE]MBV0909253.1 TetR/AcrR family transcriptional regulator [Planococcus sp. CP5-4_UN]MBW6063745.1 TetR/AcrR family transcriptional regulator [Planococcus sp. CP5-4]
MPKKQQILGSALQLFAERGIEATSVQHITEDAGISKGAFYLSFPSKESLIKEIIDSFMRGLVADIDQVVNSPKNADEKLRLYFLAHLALLEKHADFAKIYAQEPMHALNEEILEKLIHYDAWIDRSLLALLDELHGEQLQGRRYDLLISIKGFVRIYSQLVLFHPYPHDIGKIADLLVEKTNVLAAYSHTAYLTEEMVELPMPGPEEVTTSEKLLMVIDELLEDEQHPPLIAESISLLAEEIQSDTPRRAILHGLQANIYDYAPAKWLSYLLKKYEQKKSPYN